MGDSVLNRVYQVLARFNQSFDGSSILLSDFSTNILKIKGLAEILSANDRSLVANRAAALDMSRSVARTTIIDAEESYERQTTAVAGLSDLLDKWMERLAAAARMPISILFGRQPAGSIRQVRPISSAGTAVWAHRTQDLQPRLERILRVLFRAKDGPTGGVEPESWSIVWPALRQLTEAQEADRRQKIAQTDQIYYSLGAVTSDEIRRSRFGGERYNAETSIDPSADDFRLVQNPDLSGGWWLSSDYLDQQHQLGSAPTTIERSILCCARSKVELDRFVRELEALWPQDKRADASGDPIQRLLDETARRLGRLGPTHESLKKLTLKYGQQTADLQKRQLLNQARAAVGVDLLTAKGRRRDRGCRLGLRGRNVKLVQSLGPRLSDDLAKLVSRATCQDRAGKRSQRELVERGQSPRIARS